MAKRREILVENSEEEGIPIDQLVALIDVLLAAGPGLVRVTIETVDNMGGGE